jgi:hypothetical protein
MLFYVLRNCKLQHYRLIIPWINGNLFNTGNALMDGTDYYTFSFAGTTELYFGCKFNMYPTLD